MSYSFWTFRWPTVAGAIFCLLSVVIGAFSAHGLKTLLDSYALGLIETAAQYQMYHGLALIALAVLSFNFFSHTNKLSRWYKVSAISFTTGVLVFCGSLYLIAFTGHRFFGMIAPIGGIAFIFGWFSLIMLLLSEKSNKF
jgi:uncharacterized membrane protein YgdD (TMEM256/DUF423 family)